MSPNTVCVRACALVLAVVTCPFVITAYYLWQTKKKNKDKTCQAIVHVGPAEDPFLAAVIEHHTTTQQRLLFRA